MNTAAVGSTTVPPLEILRLAKELEREAGRDPTAERWSARELDIDLLVYGELCGEFGAGEGQTLVLPHPRLRERAFVLLPLAEIAPDLRVPPDGRKVLDLLSDLPARSRRILELGGSGSWQGDLAEMRRDRPKKRDDS